MLIRYLYQTSTGDVISGLKCILHTDKTCYGTQEQSKYMNMYTYTTNSLMTENVVVHRVTFIFYKSIDRLKQAFE